MYKVLFLDDREMDNMLNKLMVREDHLPFDAVYITSGEEALEYLNDQNDEDFPELIFIDINMPDMNGYEFVEAYNATLRSLPKAANTKLVFLTASVSDSDKQKALAMPNITAFYNKPISTAVYQNLQQYLG